MSKFMKKIFFFIINMTIIYLFLYFVHPDIGDVKMFFIITVYSITMLLIINKMFLVDNSVHFVLVPIILAMIFHIFERTLGIIEDARGVIGFLLLYSVFSFMNNYKFNDEADNE